jgi:hypothetical protein
MHEPLAEAAARLPRESFAVQLAKRLGAHVTGVDNAAKLEFMRSVGADEVIDYGWDDFTRTTRPYDLILDLVAHRSVFAYRRALAPGGRYRCVGGSVPTLLRVLTVGWLVGRPTGRAIGILAVKEGPAHFQPLAALCVRQSGCRPLLTQFERERVSHTWYQPLCACDTHFLSSGIDQDGVLSGISSVTPTGSLPKRTRARSPTSARSRRSPAIPLGRA